ncbi:MAG: hypothetical protein HY689_11795 [Chloroflexi bacterium]|nr:hypothetical protein [Chloroflexota bacterium]
MNRKEQTRLMVLAQVDRADLTAPQAAAVLDRSLRQVRRRPAGAFALRGIMVRPTQRWFGGTAGHFLACTSAVGR